MLAKGRARKTPFHPAVMRAVSGDIHRTTRMRGEVGDIRVLDKIEEDVKKGHVGKDWDWNWESGSGEVKEPELERKGDKEVVRFEVLQQWDTFIIYGEDGRVVVVDGDGEWDSGPMPQPQPVPQQNFLSEQPPTTECRKKQVNFQDKVVENETTEANHTIIELPIRPLSARQLRRTNARGERKMDEEEGKELFQ